MVVLALYENEALSRLCGRCSVNVGKGAGIVIYSQIAVTLSNKTLRHSKRTVVWMLPKLPLGRVLLHHRQGAGCISMQDLEICIVPGRVKFM